MVGFLVIRGRVAKYGFDKGVVVLINKKIVLASALAVMISGCASHTKDLQATNVSPLAYKDMSCIELMASVTSNANKIEEIATAIDAKADNDQAQAVVGAILFWPVLFALEGGDGPEAAEYSRLKGEINAMEHVAITNECPAVVAKVKDYRDMVRAARKAEQDKRNSSWD